MKRRMLKSALTVALTVLVMALLCVCAVAEATDYGIFVGGVKLTSENLTIDSNDASSGVTEGTIVYDPADSTLTLTGVTAEPSDAAAIHVTPGTTLEIVLVGDNTLKGAPGCAGIFVEAGWDGNGDFSKEASAEVTITGDGSLVAIGGDAVYQSVGGGAGIGGNGFGDPACDYGGDFGVIIIEGGNITATGGDDDSEQKPSAGSDHGAGAGIGGGGIKGNNYSFSWTYSGCIEISGGTVNATGGNGYTGAAGIGSGNAGSSDGTYSDITILITGGNITANGGTDAAGIGGSSNGASGPITITGGTVTATGGDENDGSSYGGAGIGGGDNGDCEEIIIKGDADVTAYAGGAAAGIGGGNGGHVMSISIDENADVTAYGGAGTKSDARGGAAIGSGNGGGFGYTNERLGKIYINTEGKVMAYAGREAMAIGTGTQPKSKYYFEVGKNVNHIWMFTKETVQKPFIDDPAYISGFADTLTAFYELPDGESFPAEDTLADAITIPDSVVINWMYNDNELSIIRDGSTIASQEYDSSYSIGNWAAVIPQVDFSISYVWDGDLPNGDFEQTLPDGVEKAIFGSTHTVDTTFTQDTVIENVVDGVTVGRWLFSGWDKSGDLVVEESIVISGTWYYESYISVEFDKALDDNGDPLEDRGERIYNIKLVAYNGKDINRLNSVDLSFILDNSYGKNAYEIIDISGDNIAVNAVDTDRYEFHFETKTNVTNDTAASITLARVKFTGYGAFTFSVDSDVDTNAVHATKLADNIVDTYVPGGVTADGKKVGVLVIENFIEDEIFTPVQTLTVNVSFPNVVNFNDTDYQQMNVTVTGTDIEEISVDLGTDNSGESITAAHKPDASYEVVYDEGNDVITVTFTGILTANTTYNVSVSGAGYRTARYSVTMTDDKELNFWNNVKDNEAPVEEGKYSATKNFLAGDIVGDNEINIYDLSAVVSYFSTEITDEADYDRYVKYDLNRDGIIDSRDVAYVLVSWQA